MSDTDVTILATGLVVVLAFAGLWLLDVRRDRRRGEWSDDVPRDLTAYRARRDALRTHEGGPAA